MFSLLLATQLPLNLFLLFCFMLCECDEQSLIKFNGVSIGRGYLHIRYCKGWHSLPTVSLNNFSLYLYILFTECTAPKCCHTIVFICPVEYISLVSPKIEESRVMFVGPVI